MELLVVIAVIAILVILALPVVSTVRTRGQRAQCTANLRNLYLAANLCVQQNGSWPQIFLASSEDNDAQTFAKQWIDALRPFGPSEKTWICPTVQEEQHNPDYTQSANTRIDYMPMAFDDKPTTPHQWPRYPWFMEQQDVHGNGQLIAFADGSISDLKTIAASASPSPTPK